MNKQTDALVRLYDDFDLMAEMGGAGVMRGVRRADVGKLLARRDENEARAWAAEHAAELVASGGPATVGAGMGGGGGGGGAALPLNLIVRAGTSGTERLVSLARSAKGGVSGLASGATAALLMRPHSAHAAMLTTASVNEHGGAGAADGDDGARRARSSGGGVLHPP